MGLDAKRLSSTYQSLGYEILIFRNLTADQIKSHLSATGLEIFAKKPLKNYASLIDCLLGHGDEDLFLGVDEVPVSLNAIQYGAFNDHACPDLKGKPKVVIVSACQGKNEQCALQTANDPSKSSSMAVVHTDSSITNNDYEERLPPVCDFIRLSSSSEEYKSYFCKY